MITSDGRIDIDSDCQHMAPMDDQFTARARFHQSWYRRHILKRSPGPNPNARGKIYGNILRPEDARKGLNFLDDITVRITEERIAQGLGGVTRLRGNLLSSQPMCFNLFAHLKQDLKLATRLISTMPGLPNDLQVADVIFEYPPVPEQHLADRTAFDAFIPYTRPGGLKGFIGIETKYTEPFSQKEYPLQKGYSRWLELADRWWLLGAEEHFSDMRFNQLWRNHLLAFAMLHQQPPAFAEGYCAVIYHKEDKACAEAIGAYRSLLKPTAQPTLLNWPLRELVDRWRQLAATEGEREWLQKFADRYLDLAASEPAWDAYRQEQRR